MNALSNKRIWWLIIAVAVIWFSNLEYRKLIKPDEGRYAEVPREMVVSGDWVTPRLNDLKYFEKPPLQYWATAVAYEAFGKHQWTSRLWTALTGFCGVLLVWFAGNRLFGREAANYAALMLSSSFLYVGMSHINTLDMGVTFFITLGIIGLLLAEKEYESAQYGYEYAKRASRNWMLVAWAAMALAVLSKGLMGIVLPGAALFLYCIVKRDFSVLKRMHWLPGLAVFMLIAVPWFYLVMKANPEFFHFFFVHEHFERFTTKVHGRYQPWYYFIPIMLAGMMPWTMVMLDTIWRSVFAARREPSVTVSVKFDAERFLLIWAAFVFVFFSISDSKLPSYVLPIFPALALLMGARIAEISMRRLFWLVAPVLPLMLAGAALTPLATRLADTPLRVQMYGEYAVWVAVAMLLWAVGTAAALVLLYRDRKLIAVIVLSISALIGVQVGVSGYNTIARERSAYHLADAIRPYVKKDVPFYSVMMYEQTLPFYLKRTFTLVQFEDEMAFGITQEPQRWIPDVASFAKVWQAQPEALAIMPVEVYPMLKQQEMAMKIVYEDTQYVVVSK